jgi:hypothetical protein
MKIRHHQIDGTATKDLLRLLGGIGRCHLHPERREHGP